jgi:hypothetical protein
MYPAARRTFRTSLDPVDGSVGPQKSSGQRPREKETREQPQPRNIKASSQQLAALSWPRSLQQLHKHVTMEELHYEGRFWYTLIHYRAKQCLQ